MAGRLNTQRYRVCGYLHNIKLMENSNVNGEELLMAHLCIGEELTAVDGCVERKSPLCLEE